MQPINQKATGVSPEQLRKDIGQWRQGLAQLLGEHHCRYEVVARSVPRTMGWYRLVLTRKDLHYHTYQDDTDTVVSFDFTSNKFSSNRPFMDTFCLFYTFKQTLAAIDEDIKQKRVDIFVTDGPAPDPPSIFNPSTRH